MDAEISTLKVFSRWNRLYAKFGCFGGPPDLMKSLVDRYSSPTRHYHNFDHVKHMLTFADGLIESDELFVAILYHDAIYDPTGKDNEEQSAELAATILQNLAFPQAFIDEVSALILCTKAHVPLPMDPLSSIMIDADLAILGESEANYRTYADAIRKEYAFVPDDKYRAGRTQVLRRFLERERIYLTDHLFESHEAQARRNIANEIDDLKLI